MIREIVLTFKATEDLDRLIKMAARRQECSKAAIMRQAINEYFERHPAYAALPAQPQPEVSN